MIVQYSYQNTKEHLRTKKSPTLSTKTAHFITYIIVISSTPNMSLQICPKCHTTNPYWKIYAFINLRRFDRWSFIECDFCKQKMEVDYDIPEKKYCVGVAWMSLPILMIVLWYFRILSFLDAGIIVVVFHFWAMYYLIKRLDYKAVE
jgi:hypothetical protein